MQNLVVGKALLLQVHLDESHDTHDNVTTLEIHRQLGTLVYCVHSQSEHIKLISKLLGLIKFPLTQQLLKNEFYL